jgi:antitoxin (DNA-binding transcriptional repressor) of toxin-antitoxin stability system
MGNLMIRNEKGIITHLGDRATAAVEAAEKGEEVILTVNGEKFSKIIDRREIKL